MGLVGAEFEEIVEGDTGVALRAVVPDIGMDLHLRAGCKGIEADLLSTSGWVAARSAADSATRTRPRLISALAAMLGPGRFEHHADAGRRRNLQGRDPAAHPVGRRRLSSSSTGPASRAAPGARCTSRRSPRASLPSSGSRRCVGSFRSGSTGRSRRTAPRWRLPAVDAGRLGPGGHDDGVVLHRGA